RSWSSPARLPIWNASVIFFFQAEDGIRDLIVTGVQTCALPIFRAGQTNFEQAGGPRAYFGSPAEARADEGARTIEVLGAILEERSEERRVGKEGRWRWGQENGEEKQVIEQHQEIVGKWTREMGG